MERRAASLKLVLSKSKKEKKQKKSSTTKPEARTRSVSTCEKPNINRSHLSPHDDVVLNRTLSQKTKTTRSTEAIPTSEREWEDQNGQGRKERMLTLPLSRKIYIKNRGTSFHFGHSKSELNTPEIRRKRLERDGVSSPECLEGNATVQSPRRLGLHKSSLGSYQCSSSVPVSPKKYSHPGKRSLAMKFGLRPGQEKALLITWHQVFKKPHMGLLLIQRILNELCSEERKISEIFIRGACIRGMAGKESTQASRLAHSQHMFHLLNEVIQSLDRDAEQTMELLESMGRNHTKLTNLGFSNIFLDNLGQKFLEVLALQEPIRKQHLAIQAWTKVIAGIIEGWYVGFLKKNS